MPALVLFIISMFEPTTSQEHGASSAHRTTKVQKLVIKLNYLYYRPNLDFLFLPKVEDWSLLEQLQLACSVLDSAPVIHEGLQVLTRPKSSERYEESVKYRAYYIFLI